MGQGIRAIDNYFDSQVTSSVYDNIDLLVRRYFQLLFFAFSHHERYSGLEYMTMRNGLFARIVLEEDGFVNYVQADFGKWDFNDPKYRRKVSPNFVLHIFNASSCCHILTVSSWLGFDIEKLDYSFVIKNIDAIRKNGIHNISIGTNESNVIVSDCQNLYLLITEFFKNVRPFYERISSKPDNSLLTLDNLISAIHLETSKKLRNEQIQYLSSGYGYDNPIKVEYLEELDLMEIENGLSLPFVVSVDYSTAKEFDKSDIINITFGTR